MKTLRPMVAVLCCCVAGAAAAATTPELSVSPSPTFFFPSREPGAWESRAQGAATIVSERGVVLAGELGSVRWQALDVRGAVRAEGTPQARVHDFVGAADGWRRDLPAYEQLVVHDETGALALQPLGAGFKYALTVPPKAGRRVLSFLIDGADSVQLSPERDAIVVQVGARIAVDEGLMCVQRDPAAGERRVDCRFVAPRQVGTQRFIYGIEIAAADPELAVEVDPYFHWVSYVGSSTGAFDTSFNVAQDPAGNVLVAGFASSASLVPSGATTVRPYAAQKDGFLLQASPDGSSVAWVLFLGGAESEEVHALAVDGGRAYVAGATSSLTDFPLVTAFDQAGSGTEGWITAVDLGPHPTLAFSSFMGGDLFDDVEALAARSGYVYLTGHTDSANFPVTGGAYRTTKQSGSDGYVAKVTFTGTLVWATYFGGHQGDEFPYDIDVDDALNAYVVGWTNSADFPIAGGISSAPQGGLDAFALRLSASGATLDWSFLHATSSDEELRACHFDPSASALYIAGYATAPWVGVTGADSTFSGTSEGFLSRVRADGSLVDWTSWFGGAADESIEDVATDPAGNVYATGVTSSVDLPGAGLPDPTLGSGGDAFVVRFRGDGSAIDWSSYVGGDRADLGLGIFVVASNDVLIAGYTSSDATEGFPIKGGFDETYDAPRDGFVGRVRFDASGPAGTVNDGPAEDLDQQDSVTTLEANWPSVSDPESGIAEFQYAIGTTPGGTEVSAFVSVGTATSFVRTDLSLTRGTTYYVTVLAENLEGVSSLISSDGVTISGGSADDAGLGDGGGLPDGGGAVDGGAEPDGGTGSPPPGEPVSLIGFSCAAAASTADGIVLLTGLAFVLLFASHHGGTTRRRRRD